MKQAFSSHPIMGVEPGTIDTPFVDAVVEYLAYVAFVSLAAAIAIVSLRIFRERRGWFPR